MRGRRATAASALALAALMVAGCDGASSLQPEPTGELTRTAAPQSEGMQDAAVCAAVSDVQSIVENADIALGEGRMTVQEQQGWYAVATRALHRIPSDGEGAVSQGVAALQEAVPVVKAGTKAEPIVFTSDAWSATLAGLDEPCRAAGSELSISVFTGG